MKKQYITPACEVVAYVTAMFLANSYGDNKGLIDIDLDDPRLDPSMGE